MLLLLDSDVMIDTLRGHPPAVAWMNSHAAQTAGIPGFAVLELIAGCASPLDAKRVETFTGAFKVYWPSAVDLERTRTGFADLRLSYGVGIIDALIAETAVGLDATLCTFNQRHFQAVPSLRIQQPYIR